MSRQCDIDLRVVSDAEIPAWAHLAAMIPGPAIGGEAEQADRLARAPQHARQSSYLAWRGDRAVARLRLRVHGARADVWDLGLTAEVLDEGLDAALIGAIEARARAQGATRFFVEVGTTHAGLLTKAGYRVTRVRVALIAQTVHRPVLCDRPMRHPRPDDEADVAAMGRLMYDTYHDTIDDIGQSLGEALEEAGEVLRGDYGTFLAGCSFVLEGDGEPAGATWVMEHTDDEVLLAEVMVHPSYRGRGYARPLIQAAMNACLDQGRGKMVLAVTRNNVLAEGLYRRMGFEEDPGSEFCDLEKELAD
jgi:ribosomal protein S18 acetylase RimI-like enzyme